MPSNKRKKIQRLGEGFGGLLGGAVKALKTGGAPGGKSKTGKKRKTKKEILDSIF